MKTKHPACCEPTPKYQGNPSKWTVELSQLRARIMYAISNRKGWGKAAIRRGDALSDRLRRIDMLLRCAAEELRDNARQSGAA